MSYIDQLHLLTLLLSYTTRISILFALFFGVFRSYSYEQMNFCKIKKHFKNVLRIQYILDYKSLLKSNVFYALMYSSM